jgi:hypothetical protein
LPTSPSSSTATCRYTLVVNKLAWPAAALTSANVPPKDHSGIGLFCLRRDC